MKANLPAGVSWDGATHAGANARDLLNLAKQAAASKMFGVGAALAVLASEECAKAVGLATHAASASSSARPVAKFFRDHRHKHDASAVFFVAAELLSRIAREVELIATDSSVAEHDKGSILMKRLLEEARHELAGTKKSPFEDIADWRKTADKVKQNGFYVDWDGKGWSSPAQLTQAAYLVQEQRAEMQLDFVDAILGYGFAEMKRAHQELAKRR